jgi:tRNA modification GTPase
MRILWSQRRFFTSSSCDTIFALASGQGKAGVSVIRVSGSNAVDSLSKLVAQRPFEVALSNPRLLKRGQLLNEQGQIIDEAMFTYFKGPNSFTGEDVVEYHVHGSIAVITAFLGQLGRFKGHRHALPGEFTLRAFTNRKMNLAEVEGLADLIDAETEEQRKLAIWNLGKKPSQQMAAWRKQIIEASAQIEAWIDFGDDENIEADVVVACKRRLKHLKTEIERRIISDSDCELIRHGFKIVLAGRPNVGKSSLLNKLVGRRAAIESPISGTTRDIIRVNMELAGFPVILSDTAGLNLKSQDEIEIEGIGMALESIKEADLVLFMIDGSDLKGIRSIGSDISQSTLIPERTIFVLNKADVTVINSTEEIRELLPCDFRLCAIIRSSCRDPLTLQDFKDFLSEHLRQRLMSITSKDPPVLSQKRHRQCIANACDHINACLQVDDMVMGAEHLRKAVAEIGKVTGEVNPEEILDNLFSSFCIGK